MGTLLQISDPHFGTDQQPVVDALLRLAAELEPELAVISGDVTQRARRAQFEAARRFANALPCAYVVVPGNHDIPLYNIFARIFSPYGGYIRAFGEDIEPEQETDAFVVVCTNTTRPRRHKDGEISDAQIARVCERLERAQAGKLRVVVTHQPVLAIQAEDRKNLLHHHEAAVRAWSRAGGDIVMGGHIHLPYIRSVRDQFSDLPRQMWAVQAGTAVSWRIRGNVPNSVNALRYEPGASTCSAERWDFDAAKNDFQCVRAEELAVER